MHSFHLYLGARVKNNVEKYIKPVLTEIQVPLTGMKGQNCTDRTIPKYTRHVRGCIQLIFSTQNSLHVETKLENFGNK